MQDEIEVMRFSWKQITCGDTGYMLTLKGSLLGDSQALFELSSYWTNVTYFEFPLVCSSNYSATMKSRNAAGMSDTSMPVYGTTGRLHLTKSGVTSNHMSYLYFFSFFLNKKMNELL